MCFISILDDKARLSNNYVQCQKHLEYKNNNNNNNNKTKLNCTKFLPVKVQLYTNYFYGKQYIKIICMLKMQSEGSRVVISAILGKTSDETNIIALTTSENIHRFHMNTEHHRVIYT